MEEGRDVFAILDLFLMEVSGYISDSEGIKIALCQALMFYLSLILKTVFYRRNLTVDKPRKIVYLYEILF